MATLTLRIVLIVATATAAAGFGSARAEDQPQTFEILIGQTPITIPVPAGFAVQSDLSAYQRWAEDNLDPNARALAGLIEVPTSEAAGVSTPSIPVRELVISSLAGIEQRSFSRAEFDEVAVSLRRAIADAKEAATKVAPEEVVVDGDGEPSSQPASPSPTTERPRVLTEIVYQDAQVVAVAPLASQDLEGLPPEIRFLRATAYLHVRDKLLIITALAEVSEQQMLVWLRSAPHSWSRAILAANPPLFVPGEMPATREDQLPSRPPLDIEHEPIGAESGPEASSGILVVLTVVVVVGFAVAIAIAYVMLHRRSGTQRADLPRPVRTAARRGKLMVVIGVTLVIIVLITNFAGRFLEMGPGVGLGITIALNVAILAGAFLFYRGRQYRAKAAALQPPNLQAQAPVLYLRSFKADPTVSRQTFSALLLVNVLRGLATVEEQLAAVVEPIGPLVAIGEPQEALPTPGGVRLYESNEAWQQAVSDLIQRARLVIILAGGTSGLWWEIERCRELIDPKRLLLLFLRGRKAQYDAFVEKAKDVLGVELPADTRLRKKGGFVAFDRDWRPRLLPLRAPFTRTRMYWPLKPLFNHALQPVFEVLQVPWQPSPVAIGRIVVLSLVGAFVAFAVVFVVAAMMQ